MKKEHRLYKVQKGDSLQSIAQKFKITPQELRRYHNTYCELVDLIEEEGKLSWRNDVLLLPPVLTKEEEVEKKKENKKVNFYKNSILPFKPSLATKQQYGIEIEISYANKKNRVHYEVSVEWLKNLSSGEHLFEIDRLSKTFINEQETNYIAEVLAERINQVIYPIKIVTDKDANFLRIDDFGEINYRWHYAKKQIRKEYPSEIAEEFLTKCNETFSDENTVFEALQRDYFFASFFGSKLYTEYSHNWAVKNTFEFPLIGELFPLQIHAMQEISPMVDEHNLIVISQKASLADIRFIAQPIQSISVDESQEFSDIGTYHALFYLNPHHHLIEVLYIECILPLSIPKKITININNMHNTDLTYTNKTDHAPLLVKEEIRYPKISWRTHLLEFLFG